MVPVNGRAAERIGILTLHHGYNEGAMLQAFSLARNLEQSIPGTCAEIVDQRYPSKVAVYGPPSCDRTRALETFLDETLPLSKERFVDNDHLRSFSYVRNNCSAVVTGSDELWKVKYSRKFLGLVTEQSDPWCPAFPNAYWADDSLGIPRIAYAASVGSTDWRTIPSKHREQMREILSGYSLLGIRDERTMRFVEWLDPRLREKGEWVPDPTFSFDFQSLVDRETLRRRLEEAGVDFSHPRIGTVLMDSPVGNTVLRQLREKGWQVVSFTLANKEADVPLHDLGLTPLEWSVAFGMMDFCILQRMHACISCLLSGTPFVAVDFYGNPLDDDTKLKDLLRRFNVGHFYASPADNGKLDLERPVQLITAGEWPRDAVAQTVAMFRRRSEEFTGKIREVVTGASR